MPDFKKINFYNPTKGNLSFEKVVDEVFNYLMESIDKEYEIIVGCDSSSDRSPSFPVALVILKKGEGGRFFLAKIKYDNDQKFYNFHQRILQEVLLSCELALSFKTALEKKFEDSKMDRNYNFQYIHADVSENGSTRDMIKEVVGLIKSNGFEAKIKPESFAASVVADKFT